MKIRIGSRTSKLALKQVEIAMKRIGVGSFEIIGVDTAGDKSSREKKVQFDKKNFVEDIAVSYTHLTLPTKRIV